MRTIFVGAAFGLLLPVVLLGNQAAPPGLLEIIPPERMAKEDTDAVADLLHETSIPWASAVKVDRRGLAVDPLVIPLPAGKAATIRGRRVNTDYANRIEWGSGVFGRGDFAVASEVDGVIAGSACIDGRWYAFTAKGGRGVLYEVNP